MQLACQAIPDRPDASAHLDPDTTVSHHTFHVALRAASAVCVAIDRVIRGQAANAFCVVRPPGHHAGPRGIVVSKKDRTGSHGFCLLNNVAIGAAYAMNVHRWVPRLTPGSGEWDTPLNVAGLGACRLCVIQGLAVSYTCSMH
jgi:acetoin utilization deacetylase AcuC-like enzyme